MKKNNLSNLEQRVAELENLLDSITDGFFSLDADWKFINMNKAFASMCGQDRAEMIGKDYWEQFPKAKNQKFFTEYNTAKDKGVVRHFEEYSNSLKKWVSVNVYPSNGGLNIYFTDETEQHNLRTALADNERNIRALINNTNDFIWSVDKQLHLLYANTQFEEAMTGNGKTRIKKGDDVLLFEKDKKLRATWKNNYERALAGETLKVLEENEQTNRVYETVLNPIFADDKTIVGVSCFSRDITERLQHTRQIEKHNKNLEEIAWLYSHKVRKHVATILGLVSIIDNDSDSHRQILEGVASCAKDLDAVIRDINTKSRADLEANK